MLPKIQVNGCDGKWSIGIGYNHQIIVHLDNPSDPNYRDVVLPSATIDDLKYLGDMFLAAYQKAKDNLI